MPGPLVYLDRSRVREGALEELRGAIAELAEFVEASEPHLISYSAYLSEDGSEMTVIHVHADSASLERHLEIAGPRFGPFAELVSLRGIEIYGAPSGRAVEQLRDKARLLGAGEVSVSRPCAGFLRLEPEAG